MNANGHVSTRYGRPLAVAHALVVVGLFTDAAWLSVLTGDLDALIGAVCAIGAVSAWVASTHPMRSPCTAETTTIAAGSVLILAFVGNAVYFGSGRVGPIAFVAIVALTFRFLEAVVSEGLTPMTVVDDKLLGVCVGAAAMVLTSLFVLPWYSLGVERLLTVRFNFLDLKDLYDGYVGDSSVRILYLESGFVVSSMAALTVLAIAYRGRSKPLSMNPPLRWLLVGAIALMGIWQLVLVMGLGDADADGSVQFGAWVGVAGHALLGYGAWSATRPTALPQSAAREGGERSIPSSMPPPRLGPPSSG